MERTIKINTEYIRLDNLMKLSGTVQTGGEAKIKIQGGNVKVNGETCLMRGKKMRSGDSFTYEGKEIHVE
jgi:ribosome-associated protein